MKLYEMSNHTLTLLQVLDEVQRHPSPYTEMNIEPMEIYYTYVGRHDQPDTYDKRPCIVSEDFGNKLKVFKITHEVTGDEKRQSLDISDLSLDKQSEIRFEDKPYIINKNWLRSFAGTPSYEDKIKINNKVRQLLNNK